MHLFAELCSTIGDRRRGCFIEILSKYSYMDGRSKGEEAHVNKSHFMITGISVLQISWALLSMNPGDKLLSWNQDSGIDNPSPAEQMNEGLENSTTKSVTGNGSCQELRHTPSYTRSSGERRAAERNTVSVYVRRQMKSSGKGESPWKAFGKQNINPNPMKTMLFPGLNLQVSHRQARLTIVARLCPTFLSSESVRQPSRGRSCRRLLRKPIWCMLFSIPLHEPHVVSLSTEEVHVLPHTQPSSQPQIQAAVWDGEGVGRGGGISV